MAYVPGVKYDLFISYARKDDTAPSGGVGWVSAFVDDLKRALENRLDLATGVELETFFDLESLRSNDDLEALKDGARNAAVFVAVGSPNYVVRDWTIAELDAFSDDPRSAGRIFKIESLPPDAEYPESLRTRNHVAFWERKPNSETRYKIARGHQHWDSKIQDVATHIKEVLRKLRGAGGVGPVVDFVLAAPPAALVPSRTVFLAQVTDDLDGDREQVRRYLEQFNISVVPAGPLPQGGADFKRAFEADLARANLFVQLLGPHASRRPPDLPEGYTRYQYEAAQREAEKRPELGRLLWRRPDPEPAVTAHDDAALLAMPDTLAMGLEAFKAEIVRWIDRVNEQKKPKPDQKPHQGINVFVNASPEDSTLATAIQEEFKRNGCSTVRSVYDRSAPEIMRDLKENIVWCDALALIYGQTEVRWIERQAMLYSKLKRERDEPVRAVLICRGPPQPKQEHGVSMQELREVDYADGSADSPIARLLAEWRP